jgi:hypothetical protein
MSSSFEPDGNRFPPTLTRFKLVSDVDRDRDDDGVSSSFALASNKLKKKKKKKRNKKKQRNEVLFFSLSDFQILFVSFCVECRFNPFIAAKCHKLRIITVEWNPNCV